MMKHKLIPVLSAAVACVCVLSACAGTNNNRVPEGTLYHIRSDIEREDVLGTQPVETTVSVSTEPPETTDNTQPKTEAESTVATAATAAATVATTPAPAGVTIPADNVNSENFNPNLSSIQNRIGGELRAMAVSSISLSKSELTLEEGQSGDITVNFTPEKPDTKIITLSAQNRSITAKAVGEVVTVTGLREGSSRLTVTSKNGKSAVCAVTVIKKETEEKTEAGPEITDDTVLGHSELVTAKNAARWNKAIIEALESNGFVRNTALTSKDIEITTDAAAGNMSFNAAQEVYKKLALELASSFKTDGGALPFNCIARPGQNGEFRFVISIEKTAE